MCLKLIMAAQLDLVCLEKHSESLSSLETSECNMAVKLIYEFHVFATLRNTVGMRELENRLNGSLRSFGITEQLRIGMEYEIGVFSLEIDRELNQSQRNTIAKMIGNGVADSMKIPVVDIRVECCGPMLQEKVDV